MTYYKQDVSQLIGKICYVHSTFTDENTGLAWVGRGILKNAAGTNIGGFEYNTEPVVLLGSKQRNKTIRYKLLTSDGRVGFWALDLTMMICNRMDSTGYELVAVEEEARQ